MTRETQTEKIQRLESELAKANDRIDELEAERLDALNSLAESYGVEIFDPGDGSDSDETDGEAES